MIVPDLIWRFAAVATSLVVHFYLLTEWSEQPLIALEVNEQPPNQLFVQLDFSQPQPEQVMPVEEPPPQAKVQKPEPKAKPKPKPKQKPRHKPKPTPKPVAKPKPAPESAKPPPEEIAEQSEESSPAPPPPASHRIADLRNEYLGRLLAKIEKNKFYPPIARRRNLQGMIQVHFRLGCRGEVEALKIDGEHSLLRKAAGMAIEAAHPLPQIPAEIECPMLIDYAMAYTLEN